MSLEWKCDRCETRQANQFMYVASYPMNWGEFNGKDGTKQHLCPECWASFKGNK